MSTKATIRYGEDIHLYEEVFEPDVIYRFSLQKAVELGLISEAYAKEQEA